MHDNLFFNYIITCHFFHRSSHLFHSVSLLIYFQFSPVPWLLGKFLFLSTVPLSRLPHGFSAPVSVSPHVLFCNPFTPPFPFPTSQMPSSCLAKPSLSHPSSQSLLPAPCLPFSSLPSQSSVSPDSQSQSPCLQVPLYPTQTPRPSFPAFCQPLITVFPLDFSCPSISQFLSSLLWDQTASSSTLLRPIPNLPCHSPGYNYRESHDHHLAGTCSA